MCVPSIGRRFATRSVARAVLAGDVKTVHPRQTTQFFKLLNSSTLFSPIQPHHRDGPTAHVQPSARQARFAVDCTHGCDQRVSIQPCRLRVGPDVEDEEAVQLRLGPELGSNGLSEDRLSLVALDLE